MLVPILVQNKALPKIRFRRTKPVIRQDVFIIRIELELFTIQDSLIDIIKSEYVLELSMLTCIILHLSFDPLVAVFKLEVRILLAKEVCVFQEISFGDANLEIALVVQSLWDWIGLSVDELCRQPQGSCLLEILIIQLKLVFNRILISSYCN